MRIRDARLIAYSRRDLVITVLLFIASVLYRPMMGGNEHSFLGMGVFILVIGLCLYRSRGRIGTGKKTRAKTFCAAIGLFLYCFFQCILLNSDRKIAGMQTCMLLVVSTIAYFLAFRRESIEALFMKLVYYVLMGFVISYSISLLIALVAGWESIYLFSIDYGYFTQSHVYFPFTTTYGELSLNGMQLKRLLGFARESGIMQIFYIWAFFNVENYFERPLIVKVLMLCGVGACLSTAGFIVFAVSLILYMNINKLFSWKTVVACVLVAVMVFVLFYSSGLRIADRAAATVNDRMISIQYGLSVFMKKPLFGGGFYSTLGAPNIQTGLCSLSALGQIGVVGGLLWLSTFLFAYLDAKDKQHFLCSNAALFITAVFAQPMIFAPVMYLFLFLGNEGKVKLVAQRKLMPMNGWRYAQ